MDDAMTTHQLVSCTYCGTVYMSHQIHSCQRKAQAAFDGTLQQLLSSQTGQKQLDSVFPKAVIPQAPAPTPPVSGAPVTPSSLDIPPAAEIRATIKRAHKGLPIVLRIRNKPAYWIGMSALRRIEKLQQKEAGTAS